MKHKCIDIATHPLYNKRKGDKDMTAHNMDSHMNFRMSVGDKVIIETAAKLKGLKPNTYARQKLLEIAKKDITEMNQMNSLFLSEKDWEMFMEIMEAPIQVNNNLKNAVSHYNKMTKE